MEREIKALQRIPLFGNDQRVSKDRFRKEKQLELSVTVTETVTLQFFNRIPV